MNKISAALAALLASACQTAPNSDTWSGPAILADASPQTMDALKNGLAQAMGVARVSLGAGDPTVSPEVAVLPPRPSSLEDRSLAAPTIFDLELRGNDCYAVHRASGAATALPGVSCRPA